MMTIVLEVSIMYLFHPCPVLGFVTGEEEAKQTKQKDKKKVKLEEVFIKIPKSAKLFMQHKSAGTSGNLLHMYHGPVDLLYNKEAFSNLIQGYEEMYKLKPRAKGTLTIKDFKQISNQLNRV